MFGLAFDPDRPLVATSAFPDGTVAAGEVFDWRAKGLQPIEALAMFQSGLVTHPPLEASAPSSPSPSSTEKPKRPRRTRQAAPTEG